MRLIFIDNPLKIVVFVLSNHALSHQGCIMNSPIEFCCIAKGSTLSGTIFEVHLVLAVCLNSVLCLKLRNFHALFLQVLKEREIDLSNFLIKVQL